MELPQVSRGCGSTSIIEHIVYSRRLMLDGTINIRKHGPVSALAYFDIRCNCGSNLLPQHPIASSVALNNALLDLDTDPTPTTSQPRAPHALLGETERTPTDDAEEALANDERRSASIRLTYVSPPSSSAPTVSRCSTPAGVPSGIRRQLGTTYGNPPTFLTTSY